ncbi:cyclic AMP-dependent transcription factor ATF-5-like [Polyodon spathula]|uniref:cyclic AMP-dependent transcription factor ATF-5-like n=1 Tax=Polyodon spathula TaxID=7913 RepID=UPI001B7EB85F|nr:cyclic AMP-dependent transcription factor ATF-5-like [Polyodon spathula]XP_041133226.1 cyclic AMP-dependent transcription factor ATF-5-like [Polyodon spathula]XP_041133227.1 cyclic AMP-dependent transcription factor ATF-5-like [Polyodon spathula]
MDPADSLRMESLYPELVSLTAEPELLGSGVAGAGPLSLLSVLKEEEEEEEGGGFTLPEHSLLHSHNTCMSEVDWMGEDMDIHLLDSLIEDTPVFSPALMHAVERTSKLPPPPPPAAPRALIEPEAEPTCLSLPSTTVQVAPYAPPLPPHVPAATAGSTPVINYPNDTAELTGSQLPDTVEIKEIRCNSLFVIDGLLVPIRDQGSCVLAVEPSPHSPKRGGSLLRFQTVACSSAPSSSLGSKFKKKEQNKKAATRYRQKKRAERSLMESECYELECRNRELRERAESIESEIQCLKELLEEIQQTRTSVGASAPANQMGLQKVPH